MVLWPHYFFFLQIKIKNFVFNKQLRDQKKKITPLTHKAIKKYNNFLF